MSLRNTLFIVLALTLVISACEQEEFTGTGLESLREFTLTPVPGARINLNSVDRQGQLVIRWSQARSGFDSPVKYTWMLDAGGGDFSDPLISSLSDNDGAETMITFTNEELDNFLADRGLAFGEELEAVWTVSATNGDITQVADSAVITLKRFVDAIAPFDLIAPGDSLFAELDIDNPGTELIIDWDSAFAGFGDAVTYTWLADEEGGDFSTPILELESDNNGIDSQLTLTHQAIDDVLADLGLDMGDIASLDWKVMARTADLELESTSVFHIDIRRFDRRLALTLVLNMSSSEIPGNFDVFVAGQFDRLGIAEVEWQQPGTNPELQLTYNETNSNYELNLRVPEANIGTSFEYKYFLATTSEPNWSHGEQALTSDACTGVDNRLVTFAAEGQVQDDEVTVWEGFCPSEARMQFLLTVTDNFPADQDLDVYIAGNLGFIEWPQPGTDDRLRMNDIGDNQYEIFLPVPNGHSGEFKFFLATKEAPNWNQGEQQVNPTMDGCDGASNRAFTFNGTESIDVTVDVWEGFCPF